MDTWRSTWCCSLKSTPLMGVDGAWRSSKDDGSSDFVGWLVTSHWCEDLKPEAKDEETDRDAGKGSFVL